MQKRVISGAVVALCLSLLACQQPVPNNSSGNAIVGTWLVKIPEAPFPYHMFVFHSDGTLVQSNPDAGDPNTSDSNLMGVWVADGEKIKGKAVEITADRTSRQFAGRGEVSFSLKVDGNTFSGKASAVFLDGQGQRIREVPSVTMQGERVVP